MKIGTRIDGKLLPGVARICNLPYRRIAFGRALRQLVSRELLAASALKIRDTAQRGEAATEIVARASRL